MFILVIVSRGEAWFGWIPTDGNPVLCVSTIGLPSGPRDEGGDSRVNQISVSALLFLVREGSPYRPAQIWQNSVLKFPKEIFQLLCAVDKCHLSLTKCLLPPFGPIPLVRTGYTYQGRS